MIEILLIGISVLAVLGAGMVMAKSNRQKQRAEQLNKENEQLISFLEKEKGLKNELATAFNALANVRLPEVLGKVDELANALESSQSRVDELTQMINNDKEYIVQLEDEAALKDKAMILKDKALGRVARAAIAKKKTTVVPKKVLKRA